MVLSKANLEVYKLGNASNDLHDKYKSRFESQCPLRYFTHVTKNYLYVNSPICLLTVFWSSNLKPSAPTLFKLERPLRYFTHVSLMFHSRFTHVTKTICEFTNLVAYCFLELQFEAFSPYSF